VRRSPEAASRSSGEDRCTANSTIISNRRNRRGTRADQ
jgi:hypothetical protein